MISNKTFGLIGGDLRQLYLAEKLKKDGNNISICGFESLNSTDFKLNSLDLKTLIAESEYIILPVPVTRDGITINAPFSNSTININEKFVSLFKNKVVFGGIISSLFECVNKHKFISKDYYFREDFMIQNAVPTAEGAIKIALNESINTIFGCNCLVIGYGRIGKVLSKTLKNMGANVTISARNNKDLTWANINQFKTININKCHSKLDIDLVFNTVPAEVLDYNALSLLKSARLIIDLASSPGGINKQIAKQFKIKVISALGLPGKHFPKTAGEIIANIIYKMIEEDNL